MKIIFMGTPEYAKVILQRVIDTKDIEVVALYTQPDKPVGRKKIMTPPEVKTLACGNSIPVYQPSRLRDVEVVAELLQIECDYIVVAAYGQILPRAILEHAPCINLHASILPQYRGASPIQQTLLNGDKQTGVTAMLMEEGLDTGAILKINTIEVSADEMVETLFERLTQVAADLTIDVLENFDSLTPIKQDEEKATHCSKITRAHGEITLDNATEIYNKYRAFTPWPGIFLENGLKLKKIELEESVTHNEMGKILKIQSDSIVVGCKEGSLRIFSVQAQSKNEVDILSYINGKRLTLDAILS
ncbi:MAG: methionyl-tRNA formyltransferase [Epsilonproteobacteria bacterium]|nr:methionyl-tRNA formyltransferase [Campylobacterota bacterium]NCO26029.1 methionyl-tRNA formyltransferase [Campylobacterota bacterium]OIO14392.1 MAG: methionyl-tRNA formyltransferase [Helicobacteraceae bacterium CG1_02_36_14]PIW25212.1 MAG: methionyl-tRNA formyltransferase [Sulfurimonas sp. CG15_BIG_FIL_POST_REV_8_21_14_020_36_339]PJE70423.1 MAG: methionyl-tRNA formyltransferase [Sulfurimonas sp. CG10_big_fil_rev_8_21_14_0_10_36_24]